MSSFVTTCFASAAFENPLDCLNQLFPEVTDYDQVPPEVWRYCQAKWEFEPIDKFNDARQRVDIDVPDLLPDPYKIQITQMYQALDLLPSQLRSVVEFDRFFKFQLLHTYSKPNIKILRNNTKINIIQYLSKLQGVLSSNTVVARRKGVIEQVILSFSPLVRLITTDLANVMAEDLVISDFTRFNRSTMPRLSSIPKNYGFVAHRDELESLYFLSEYLAIMASEREKVRVYWSVIASPDLDGITIYMGDQTLQFSSCNVPNDIDAIYCEPDKSVFIRSNAYQIPTTASFHLITAQAFHEIAHGFLNPPDASERPFLSEAIATARGERALRLLIAAERASRTPKTVEIAKQNLGTFLSVLAGAAVPQAQIDESIKFVREQMALTPLTTNERQMLCGFVQQKTKGEQLFGYLTLSSGSFYSLPIKKSSEAYDLAWAVGYFGRLSDEKTLDSTIDLAILKDVSNEIIANTVNRQARVAELDKIVEKLRSTAREFARQHAVYCTGG